MSVFFVFLRSLSVCVSLLLCPLVPPPPWALPAMRAVSVWYCCPRGLLLLHFLCSSSVGSPSPSTSPEKKVGSQGLRFRLAGFPRKPYEGRVEIQRAGEWGTICDDDFTLQAAHVLCRELGFTEATGWTHSAKYGPGSGEL